MSKFVDYVKSLKSQTEQLRHVLTHKSGTDCSKKSLSACTSVINNLETTTQVNATAYNRPTWYPDINTIADNAPSIKVENTTYYPVLLLLLTNDEISTQVSNSRTNNLGICLSTLKGAVFSDTCDNNLENITEATFEKTTSTVHTWDTTKDIKDPTSSAAVRWVLLYSTNSSASSSYDFYICNYGCLAPELILITGIMSSLNSYMKCKSLRYIRTKANAKWTGGTQYGNPLGIVKAVYENNFVQMLPTMQEIEVLNPAGAIAYQGDYYLNTFAPDHPWTLGGNTWIYAEHIDLSNYAGAVIPVIYTNYKLKTVILPSTLTSISGQYTAYEDMLDYIQIPASVTSWTAKYFRNVLYVALYNDFNISGVTLDGPKRLYWLKDLCKWLKDRTNEEAGSMIIGTKNLDNANNTYLTFNPDNKRDITFDGVTADTEGAISITEFITTQLNWTLS